MKIVTLMENTPGKEGYVAEHGLSVYLETEKHRVLLDTGATAAFMENASALGIDLRQVDILVLSHGHYDHSGGILPFAAINREAKIYLNQKAGEDYYSIREAGETYIGIDKDILQLPGLVKVDDRHRIDEELSLFSDINGRRFWPQSNLRLKQRQGETLVQDEFEHEQCLVVETEGKRILLSGCAHNGILNILDKFAELYGGEPDMVISGFHMMQAAYTEEDLENIRNTARELAGMKTVFYSGHCTGPVAFDVMKEIMGEKLQALHSGEVVC